MSSVMHVIEGSDEDATGLDGRGPCVLCGAPDSEYPEGKRHPLAGCVVHLRQVIERLVMPLVKNEDS